MASITRKERSASQSRRSEAAYAVRPRCAIHTHQCRHYSLPLYILGTSGLSFSSDLLDQADHLASRETKKPKQASLRRAVSAAYYALFHLLTWEAASLIAANADEPALQIMQRWFDHGSMHTACGIFSANALTGPLMHLAGATPLPDLQLIARAFRELQQARHSADYDMTLSWTRLKAKQNIQIARDAVAAWNRVRKTPQASIFALALLDLKRVQTERQ